MDEQTAPKEAARKLFILLCDRSGCSAPEIATKIGIKPATILEMRNGHTAVKPELLYQFKTALGWDHTTYMHMLVARLPAFSRRWMEQQPEHLRAGLLLSALRERFGISQLEFVRMLGGMESGVLSRWESGKERIPPSRIDQIIGIFSAHDRTLAADDYHFDDVLEAQFRGLCEQSRHTRLTIINARASHFGAADPMQSRLISRDSATTRART